MRNLLSLQSEHTGEMVYLTSVVMFVDGRVVDDIQVFVVDRDPHWSLDLYSIYPLAQWTDKCSLFVANQSEALTPSSPALLVWSLLMGVEPISCRLEGASLSFGDVVVDVFSICVDYIGNQ